MLLFHLRLDGGMHAHHGHAAVKTERESEQTRELSAIPRLKTRRQRFVWRSAGWSLKTLTRLVLRATPLKERITVVDTVPKATRAPPRVPIRARASECLLLLARSEKTASCWCV